MQCDKMISNILGYSLVILVILGLTECGQWKYKGPTGPQSWHELFPSACAGVAQSPIDIKPERTIYNPDLKDFALWYDPPKPGSRMKIKNNGHAIQVNTEGEFYFTNGGLKHVYKVQQFHFHWGSEDHMGSEHLLDSIAYPIEMHIVSYNSDLYGDIGEAVTEKGGLAVLGVLFEVQEQPNPVYETIIQALQHVKDPEMDKEEEIEAVSLRNLLPEDMSKYYRYNGSLTTPGCFETVTWTVFHQKQKISFGQLLKFRRVLQHKHRHHKHHGNKHSKRSAKRRHQRAAEEGARAVLEEIGIKSDSVQKGELITSLINEKHEKNHSIHAASQEPANNIQDPQLTKVSVDEESAKRADESMKEYSERLNGSPAPVDAINEDIPEWIQEPLVDNFRPVQPLNNRVVYRSFKLKDIYAPELTYNIQPNSQPEQEPEPKKTGKVATVYSKQDNNSASSVHISFLSCLIVFIISLL